MNYCTTVLLYYYFHLSISIKIIIMCVVLVSCFTYCFIAIIFRRSSNRTLRAFPCETTDRARSDGRISTWEMYAKYSTYALLMIDLPMIADEASLGLVLPVGSYHATTQQRHFHSSSDHTTTRPHSRKIFISARTTHFPTIIVRYVHPSLLEDDHLATATIVLNQVFRDNLGDRVHKNFKPVSGDIICSCTVISSLLRCLCFLLYCTYSSS